MLSRVPFGHDPGAELIALAVSSQNIGVWRLPHSESRRANDGPSAPTVTGRPPQLVVPTQRSALRALIFVAPGILLSVHATGVLLGWRVSDAQGHLLAQAELLWELKLQADPCVIASHPGGAQAAVQCAIGTKSGGVILLRARGEAPPQTFEAPNAHRNEITALAFCPRGARLASASRDRWVKLWEAAAVAPSPDEPSGALRMSAQLGDCEAWPLCLAFSHDGASLACGAMDNGVYLWHLDAAAGAAPLAARVFAHQGWVVGIAWAPDDSAFATASWDNTARIFLKNAPQDSRPLRLHKDYISNILFLPTGERLMSASYDETLAVWDWRTGEPVHHIQAHADWVLGLHDLGDARFATVAGDRTARIWQGAPPTCIAQLGEQIAGNFSAEFLEPALKSPVVTRDEFPLDAPRIPPAPAQDDPWALEDEGSPELPADTFDAIATDLTGSGFEIEVAALPYPPSEPDHALDGEFSAALNARREPAVAPDDAIMAAPETEDALQPEVDDVDATAPPIDEERADLEDLLTDQDALTDDDGAALLAFFENIPDEFELNIIASTTALDDLMADGGARREASPIASVMLSEDSLAEGSSEKPTVIHEAAAPAETTELAEKDTPSLAARLKSSLARTRNQPEQDTHTPPNASRSATPMFIASIGKDMHAPRHNPTPDGGTALSNADQAQHGFGQRSGTLTAARPLEPVAGKAAPPAQTAAREDIAAPPTQPRAPRNTMPGTRPSLVEPTLPHHESLADEFETPTGFDLDDHRYQQDATRRISSNDLTRLRRGKWAAAKDSRLSGGIADSQDLNIPDILERPIITEGLSEGSDALATDFRDLWDRRWTRAAPGMAIIRRALAADAPYRLASRFEVPHHAPRGVTIDDKAKLIASCGDDESVVVFGFDGTLAHRFEGRATAFQDVIFAADATVLLAAGDDGSIHAWLLPQRTLAIAGVQRYAQLSAHEGPVYGVALSADQKSLVSAGADASIAVWNLQRAELEARFSGYRRAIRAVGFTDAGVLSAGEDATVRQWDLNGAMLDVLKTPSPVRTLIAHQAHSVWALDDGSVWAREKQQVRELTGHSASAPVLAMRADGAALVGGSDGVVHLYTRAATQPFQAIAVGAPLQALAAAGDYIVAVTAPRTVSLFKRG